MNATIGDLKINLRTGPLPDPDKCVIGVDVIGVLHPDGRLELAQFAPGQMQLGGRWSLPGSWWDLVLPSTWFWASAARPLEWVQQEGCPGSLFSADGLGIRGAEDYGWYVGWDDGGPRVQEFDTLDDAKAFGAEVARDLRTRPAPPPAPGDLALTLLQKLKQARSNGIAVIDAAAADALDVWVAAGCPMPAECADDGRIHAPKDGHVGVKDAPLFRFLDEGRTAALAKKRRRENPYMIGHPVERTLWDAGWLYVACHFDNDEGGTR